MATEVLLTKGPGNSLVPLGEEGHLAIRNLRFGQAVKASIVQPRNVKFHRKFFALLNLGFEYWEPAETAWNGIPAEKNFERFRKDVLILAGFHDVVVNIRGESRVEAKSISFARMDEDEFSRVYQAVFNVIWTRVLRHVQGFTPELMENAVSQLLGFDA